MSSVMRAILVLGSMCGSVIMGCAQEIEKRPESLLAKKLRSRSAESFPTSANDVLSWIRAQPFNQKTDDLLRNHPVVIAARSGKLHDSCVLQHVLLEEYSTEFEDLKTMGRALGRVQNGDNEAKDFFLGAADGEGLAIKLLVRLAARLGLSEKELREYRPRVKAHAYASTLLDIETYGEGLSAVAVAFAVNFPTWGGVCGDLADAIANPENGYEWCTDPSSETDKRTICSINSHGGQDDDDPKDLDYLTYFAEAANSDKTQPTYKADYDQQVLTVLKNEIKRMGLLTDDNAVISDQQPLSSALKNFYTKIRDWVELLQETEVLFWDQIWTECGGLRYGRNQIWM